MRFEGHIRSWVPWSQALGRYISFCGTYSHDQISGIDERAVIARQKRNIVHMFARLLEPDTRQRKFVTEPIHLALAQSILQRVLRASSRNKHIRSYKQDDIFEWRRTKQFPPDACPARTIANSRVDA